MNLPEPDGWVAQATHWMAATGIQDFEHPDRLWWAIPAIAAVLLAARARKPAIEWSAYAQTEAAGARTFEPLDAISIPLRIACVVALVAVLAGPIGIHRRPPEPGYGLDLILVLDASGSMRALDAEHHGATRSRIELAREVVARFAGTRAEAGDRVGLVVFGESAFTQCPLTSDGQLLSRSLDRVEAGVAGEATALGDALVLAVKRALGAQRQKTGPEPTAGRVIVLLTDGRNNAGAVSVELATEIAAAEGIRVHTVAIGTRGTKVAMAPRKERGADHEKRERLDIDLEALEQISRATGGRLFAAQRSGDLEAVYRDIDSLERIARPMPPRIHHSPRPEPLLGAAAGLLFLEIAIARTLRRRLT